MFAEHLYISRGTILLADHLQNNIFWATEPKIKCKTVLECLKDVEEDSVKCLMKIIELKHWNKDLVCWALVYFKRHNSIGRPSSEQYLLGYWAENKMQDSSGMLEGCRRRLCQVFDEDNRAQALKQGSCLLSTCIFQEAQFYWQTIFRTKYAISSGLLSRK